MNFEKKEGELEKSQMDNAGILYSSEKLILLSKKLVFFF